MLLDLSIGVTLNTDLVIGMEEYTVDVDDYGTRRYELKIKLGSGCLTYVGVGSKADEEFNQLYGLFFK